MLARVKQDYLSGSVTAFSGHEYVRSEWREVPAGFEEHAKNHPFLDVQPSLDEVRAQGPKSAGPAEPAPEPPAEKPQPEEKPVEEPQAEPIPAEPPAEEPVTEEPEPRTARRRRRSTEE